MLSVLWPVAGHSAAQSEPSDDPCLKQIEAHGFTAVFRASSNISTPYYDPGQQASAYPDVDVHVAIPAVAEQLLLSVKLEEMPTLDLSLHFATPNEYGRTETEPPVYYFDLERAARNTLLKQSGGSEDLACRYRNAIGGVFSAPLEPLGENIFRCEILRSALIPTAEAQGGPFRLVLQSPIDGTAYFVADYPASIPADIGNVLRSTAQNLVEYAQYAHCAYGFTRP